MPARFALLQNAPNPFNPVTRIRFGLPKPTNITLEIFDIRGAQVVTLLENQPRTAGYHTVIPVGLDTYRTGKESVFNQCIGSQDISG